MNDSSLKSRKTERKGQSKKKGTISNRPHFSITLTPPILAFYPLLPWLLITRYIISFIFVWAYLSPPSLYPALSIFSPLSVQIHVALLFSLCAIPHISPLSVFSSQFDPTSPSLVLSQQYRTSSFTFSIVLGATPKECVCVCVWCSCDPLISVRRNIGGLVLPSRVRGHVESVITLVHRETYTQFLGFTPSEASASNSLVYNSPTTNTHTGIDWALFDFPNPRSPY